ncbi:MAG: PD40 domain-containing protein, partial [Acidobacteria bacterium]|nr:PD40 domain-containing protein [Acidobacteriota bacterium]
MREVVVDLKRVQRHKTVEMPAATAVRPRRRFLLAGLAAALVLVAAWLLRPADSWKNPLDGARFERLTDFPGTELDAAISADGKFVAFLSDRDGVFDAWVTQVGAGEFVNLTKGRFLQLLHESTRSVGFSGDGAQVWLRAGERDASGAMIRRGAWQVPTMGGIPRPFLARAMLALWSPDGGRILYFEPSPGDPVFVADRNGMNPQQIFIDQPGGHAHHLTWSPDGRFVFFVRGFRPNETDIWRVGSTGGTLERITHHNSRVAYPALVDDETLLYTATAEDGSGFWLYAMDLKRGVT